LTAIIIGSVILILAIIVVGAICFGRLFWIAMAAIGTVSAVVWAVFQQGILIRFNRPILEFMPFEQEPPYFRQAPLLNRKNEQAGFSYPITIPLINNGKTLANSCQPVILSVWDNKAGKWVKDINWLPKNLLWAFGGGGERNLIPRKPYQFALGMFRTTHPDKFILSDESPTTGQRSAFGPGKYCFEIKVFAENAKSNSQYFYIEWNGGCTDDFEKAKEKIRISATDHSP